MTSTRDDGPPMTIVTTTPLNESTRKPPQSIAPAILSKPKPSPSPPTNTTTTTSSSTINANAPVFTPSYQLQAQADTKIDSALLSALRDYRERRALLKLEQVLMEFMHNASCPFLEVGGQYNAVVLKGPFDANLCVAGGSNGGSGGATTSSTEHIGTIVEGGKGNWTSFHKLILHRLADRFSITREPGQVHVVMGANAGNVLNGSCASSSSSSPPQQMIRLVKNPTSRIPSVLLIDVNMADYNPTSGKDGGRSSNDANDPKGLINQMASSNLKEMGISTSGQRKSKKKEKVQIMKRSSAGKGSNGSLTEKQGSKRRTKKLSEKEKLYAEARARIFNDESAGGTTTTTAENSQEAQDSTIAESVGDKDANVIPNETSSQPSQIITSRSSTQSTESGDTGSLTSPSTLLIPSQLLDSDVAALETPGTNSPSESPSPSSPSTLESSKSQPNVPAAATGGGSSKVLWRNRQQEASDPDFQRSHHPVMVPAVPLNVVTGNIYHSSAHSHFSLSAQTNPQNQHVGGYFPSGLEKNSTPGTFTQRSSPAVYNSSSASGYTNEQTHSRSRTEPATVVSPTQSSESSLRSPSQSHGQNSSKQLLNPQSQTHLKEPQFVSIVKADAISSTDSSPSSRKTKDINTPWGRSQVEKNGGSNVIYAATEDFPELR